MSIARRTVRLVGALVLLAAALVLTACGGGNDDDRSAGAARAATTSDGGARFPATVRHRFGTTTVPQAPERIVVVGLTEQDTVLQLGHTPVATSEWYGDHPGALWPWARAIAPGAKPTVLDLSDGIPVEKVAALRPDLIIGTNSGMTRKTYAQLSRFAPTIPGVVGGTDYFSPWDQQTLLIARALGKEAEGRKLIADVKARFARLAQEHPEFEGRTATFAQNGFYSGLLYVYPDGLGTEFLSYLGFTVNPKLTPLVEKAGEQVTISPERLDVIDTDVIVFATEQAADIRNLFKVPTFRRLDAVRGGRAVYTDATLAGALYFMTPLSLMYAADRLAPQLQAALEGKAPRRMVGGA